MAGLRSIALAVALLTAMTAALPPQTAAGAEVQALDLQLDTAHAAFDGTAAVVVSDPAAGYRFARNDDMQFYSASLYKVWLLVEAYAQASAGSISLDDTYITISQSDLPWEDGWLTPAGTELSVREALEMSITWSDNSTSLALLRTLGRDNVNKTLRALGLRATWLDDVGGNLTTARDMARLFTLMLQGRIATPAASNEMVELLKRQQVNDRLPAGLPEGAAVAHKTGNLWDVAHDAGIIWTPFGARVAVVLTARAASYEEVVTLAASVASAAYANPVRPAERFAAGVAPLSFPGTAVAALPFPVTFRVTNTGNYRWSRERLTIQWTNSAGARIRSDAVTLPALEPGASAIVVVASTAPAASGVYAVHVRVTSAHPGQSSTPQAIAVWVSPQ